MKVLVTDGHLKTSLAAVRSLGRKGIEAHTLYDRPGQCLCSLSRYNAQTHLLPPYDSAKNFDEELLKLLDSESFSHILISSEGALRRVSDCREEVSRHVRVDLPPPATIEIVLSKEALLGHAQSVGIPTPRTVVHHYGDPPERILDRLRFPLVAKTAKGGAFERVRYLNRRDEFEVHLDGFHPGESVIFQEYVDGVGYGFFALYKNGGLVACQMHRRIWEYPTTGGPSVMAATTDERDLRSYGGRLLESLNWEGLAMVEFKRRRSYGDWLLMEINPRLWGSMQLCIESGVDFPYLDVSESVTVGPPSHKEQPTTYLFLLPEAGLFLAAKPSKLLEFVRYLFSRRVKLSLDLGDLRPLYMQSRELLYWLKVFIPKRALRFPHGRPLATDGFAFDLHVHTSASYDCRASGGAVLRAARRKGLGAVAITDHETMKEARRMAALDPGSGLAVIPGCEVRTSAGDIIGLFVSDEIVARDALEVAREVKRQGGVVMLPHPFQYGVTSYDEELLREIDLIEIRNARTRRDHVQKIRRLAQRHDLTLVGNSDAHFPADIGATYNVGFDSPDSPEALKELLLAGDYRIVTKKTPFRRVVASQLIKAWKNRRLSRVLFFGWWYVKSTVKDLGATLFGPPLDAERAGDDNV